MKSALLLMVTGAALCGAHELPAPRRTLTVSGEGSLRLSPTLVTVQLATVSNSSTAQEASAANAAATAAVVDFITSLRGVEERDVRLEGLRLEQESVFVPAMRGDSRPGRFEAGNFIATRTLSVAIRDSSGDADFPALALLLGGAVEAGANRIDRVDFGLADSSAVQADALELATSDALNRAAAIVDGLGGTYALGLVQSVSEAGVFPPVPRPAMASLLREAAEDVFTTEQVAPPGELTVRASVTLVAELEGGR